MKVETLQPTGSFKVRGALAAIARAQPGDHVVTVRPATTGSASPRRRRLLGRSATVVVPETASPAKVQRLRGFPIDLVSQAPATTPPSATASLSPIAASSSRPTTTPT